MRRWAMGVDESFHTTSGARRTAQTPRGAQIPAGLPYAGHAASTPDYSAKGYCIILGVSHVKMSETQEVVAVEPVEPARSLLRNTSKSTTHIPGVSLKTCIVLNNNCSLLLKTWERRTARAGRNRPRVKTFSFPGERRAAGAARRAPDRVKELFYRG
ncbi:hypothetical protein J6590_054372 [Homalodisca vitripennis]|nr:hypothetical protein J6590_054372 [Homalodisca vitripennis]